MANKNRDTKLTLADLIAKKAAKEARVSKTEEVFVDSLDGMITIQNPGKDVVYKSIDMDKGTTSETVYANAFLVYHAVKMFQAPDLLKAYEVKDNIDIVGKLLDPYEINDIANKVFRLAGFAKPEEEIEQDLKN